MSDDDRIAAKIEYYDSQVAKSVLTPPAIAGMTLAEFLRACLDEDQRVAEEMALLDPSPWSAVPTSLEGAWEIVDAQKDAVIHSDDDCCLTRDLAEWVAAHDPSRVMAEIAAKRAILDLHAGEHECSVIDERGDVDICHWVMEGEDCTTALLLAQPFRDRPGFDERWAL